MRYCPSPRAGSPNAGARPKTHRSASPCGRTVGERRSETMQWEYFDRMVVFSESNEGMVSGLDSWINNAGAEGWELVSSVPLIAPNKDGVAYGTIGKIGRASCRERVEF